MTAIRAPLLAMALLLATGLQLASASPLIRVTVQTDEPVQARAAYLAAGFDVLEGSVTASSLDLIVSKAELERLTAEGVNIVSTQAGRPLRDIVRMNDATRGSVPNGYLDLAGINNRMAEIAGDFPAIAQLVNLTDTYGQPQSFEGRDLFALKISDNVGADEDEPAIMIVSNHHAREIITPVIALDAMDRFTSGYGSDAEITAAVDNYEIWIAAIWNPDGYNEVFTGDNFWRKNRRVFPTGIGVDQNRNYPQGWNAPCGGSDIVTSQIYRGPAPASEPETQTMIAWSQGQRFAKVIDYHSSGREVLYSYSCSSHPFTSYFGGEAFDLSVASGYFGVSREAGAEGEHFQWQVGQMGAWSHLIETATQFQPDFAMAQLESDRVWPGILHAINVPLPLSGHVTDDFTGAPVEAEITLEGVAFSEGESNASGGPFGRYHVFAPAGTYVVTFTAPGYFPQTVSIELQDGIAVTRDITLVSDAPDTDGDGAPDALDNCLLSSNPDQIDVDGDGYGNRCDGDFNNDCAVNFADTALMSAGFFGADPLLDMDGDGSVNFSDLALLKDQFFGAPGPSNTGSCP